MRVRWVVPAVASAVLLAGCSAGADPAATFDPSPPGRAPYSGALTATPTTAEARSADHWPGAAGAVVQCSSAPLGASVLGEYEDGAIASSPRQAVEVLVSSGALVLLPVDRFVEERDDGDRVLFTTSYSGIARQAVIVRNGPAAPRTGARDGRGWYAESAATCDLADFPERVSRAAGVEIWSDRRDRRVPTSRIVSARGPEHCDLQGTTFLTLDAGVADGSKRPLPLAYVDRVPAGLGEYFDESARAHVHVPDDAVDTGYSRAGRELWLSADGRRAYVGTRADARLWPREVRAFGCA